MNNKKICIILSLISFINGIYAEDSITKIEMDSDKTGIENAIVFKGFDFDIFDPTSPFSMEDIVNQEIEKIADSNENTKKDYVLVGHSEGGLRALAYETMLRKKINSTIKLEEKAKYEELYNRLSAIITVSGANKGFRGLENDTKTFISKLEADADILLGGLNSMKEFGLVELLLEISNTYNLLDEYIAKYLNDNERFSTKKRITVDNVKNLVINLLPENYKAYLKPAIKTKSVSSMPEIRDLVPGSKFIKTNVADSYSETKKIRTGTKTVWGKCKKKIGKVSLIYYGFQTVPVYKVLSFYKDIPKFSSEIPIGYIVGANNDTLQLLEDTKSDLKGIKNNTEKVMKGIDVACGVGIGVHVAKSVLITGLLTGSPKEISKLEATKKWVKDYKTEIADLLGSSKNDGLLTVESQYYPRYAYDEINDETVVVHKNVLSINESEDYSVFPEYNHKTISPLKNDAKKRMEKLGIYCETSNENLKLFDPVYKEINRMIQQSEEKN